MPADLSELEKTIEIKGQEYQIRNLLMCRTCHSILHKDRQICSEKVGHQAAQYAYEIIVVAEDSKCCNREGLFLVPGHYHPSVEDIKEYWPELQIETK